MWGWFGGGGGNVFLAFYAISKFLEKIHSGNQKLIPRLSICDDNDNHIHDYTGERGDAASLSKGTCNDNHIHDYTGEYGDAASLSKGTCNNNHI